MSRQSAPARYFPVSPGPLRMKPGLFRLGTDFGNQTADAFHFQVDSGYDRYVHTKAAVDRVGRTRRTRHVILARDDREQRVHEVVQRWLSQTATAELEAQGLSGPEGPRYDDVFAHVQEDGAVITRTPAGTDVITMLHVCFPGNWRPESIIGTSFQHLHGPVPDFADDEESARRMVDAMIKRGPYVRFVWSLSADDELDHHPEHGDGQQWRTGSSGYLRVERQVTVPFADVEAALFLIRTYVYPLAELAEQERQVLRLAVEAMPEPIARYKGIAQARPYILAALTAS